MSQEPFRVETTAAGARSMTSSREVMWEFAGWLQSKGHDNIATVWRQAAADPELPRLRKRDLYARLGLVTRPRRLLADAPDFWKPARHPALEGPEEAVP